MNRGERHPQKRSQTTKTSKERRPITKEPNMKRGERSVEIYKKATEKAKCTKKREGLEMKNKNKKRLKGRGEIAEREELTNCSEEIHSFARKLMFSKRQEAGAILFVGLG